MSEVFDRDGSDAMRWFLMSSSVLRGGNLVVTEEGIRDGVRQFILPLWNAGTLLHAYANAARGGRRGLRGDAALRRLRPTCSTVHPGPHGRPGPGVTADSTARLSGARDELRELPTAHQLVHPPLARPVLGRPSSTRASDAFDTLYTVLETSPAWRPPCCRSSPRVWQGLTGGRSVHLADWPDAGLFPANPGLVEAMDRVQQICSTGSSLRKAANLRVRLPLQELTVVAPGADARAASPPSSPTN